LLSKKFGVCSWLVSSAASVVLMGTFTRVETSYAQTAGAAVPDKVLPIWAYPVLPPVPRTGAPPASRVPDETLRHVPGSTAGYTRAQIGTLF